MNIGSEEFSLDALLRVLSVDKQTLFHTALQKTGLVEHIVNVYRNDLINKWQDAGARQIAYKNGRTDEQFAAELERIENYMLEHLPQKFFLATEHLLIESQSLAVTGETPSIEQRTRLDKEFVKVDKERSQNGKLTALLADNRGGDNNPRKSFQTSESEIEFAGRVKQLMPLWKFITKYFAKHGYKAECLRNVKKEAEFNQLANGCKYITHKDFDKLLKKVFERQNDKSQSQLQPRGFAFEHARIELALDNMGYETLKKAYDNGLKSL